MISAPSGNEQQPAIDEHPPFIAENLASNQELCVELTKHLTWTYWWTYLQIQMRFWPAWRMIDNAWRVRYAAGDLNFTAVTLPTVKAATPLVQDGKSSIGQSTMPFQQINAVINLGEILSFEEGYPFRAEVPQGIIEDPMYQPTQQTADALNMLMIENAENVGFRDKHRKAFGMFAKYGCCYVHTPFTLLREQPQPPFPGQMPEQPKIRIQTEFIPLNNENVFIDPFLPGSPMDSQPCPFVKELVSREDLDGFRYDPMGNPFGYLNVDLALKENAGHFFLTEQDTQPLRDRLQNRYNVDDQVGTNSDRSRAHKKWTCYPMLRMTEKFKLDTGHGAECPQCDGKKEITQQPVLDMQGQPQEVPPAVCPTCQGAGIVTPTAKRYCVVLYGDPSVGTRCTCLRIQELPQGMTVPILMGVDLVEDDAATIPQSKSEAMLVACEQVTRAEAQFEASKESTINRGFKIMVDSPAWKVQNFNAPNARIPIETDPREVERIEQGTFDETLTLGPYIERKVLDIQNIFGATNTLLGQLAQGRRSALEVGEATDAAKNPLVIMVDRFNHQIPGGWAKQLQQNLELFGNRDYVLAKTGRVYYAKCHIFTAVGKEFIKKLAMTATIKEVLQISAADPSMMSARPALWNELFSLVGIKTRIQDDGLLKGIADASVIINKILAKGIPDPALPSDPHAIFVRAFQGALTDPYWLEQYPQNLPLLWQRLQVQNQMLMQQQMAQMQAQMAMQGPQQGPPGKKLQDSPRGAGDANQRAQGPQGAKAA